MRPGTSSFWILTAFGLASAAPSTAHAQLPGRGDAPSPAQAAPPPAGEPPALPSAPAITAPVVKKNDGVTYPKQAIDEGVRDTVVVSILLDIDSSGLVKRAVVEKPVGHGFDEAAVAAGEKLEFAPATRDGKPVAARIRFTYTFTPPPSVLSGRVVTLVGEHPLVGRDRRRARRTRGPRARPRPTPTGHGAWRAWRPVRTTSRSAPTGRAPHEADESVHPGRGSHRRRPPRARGAAGRRRVRRRPATTSRRSKCAARSRRGR